MNRIKIRFSKPQLAVNGMNHLASIAQNWKDLPQPLRRQAVLGAFCRFGYCLSGETNCDMWMLVYLIWPFLIFSRILALPHDLGLWVGSQGKQNKVLPRQ